MSDVSVKPQSPGKEIPKSHRGAGVVQDGLSRSLGRPVRLAWGASRDGSDEDEGERRTYLGLSKPWSQALDVEEMQADVIYHLVLQGKTKA